MGPETIFNIICAAAAAVMLVYYMKRRRKLASFLFGAVTGLAALFLADTYGSLIGACVLLNAFNVTGSIILGAPFVLFVMIFSLL